MAREDVGTSTIVVALFLVVGMIVLALIKGHEYIMENQATWRQERLTWCAGATVVEVGGCNRHGECGVTLSDGRTTIMDLPAVGEACH